MGLALIGCGRLRLSPGPQTERNQLILFASSEAFSAAFDVAVVKVNPEDSKPCGVNALCGFDPRPRCHSFNELQQVRF
jgi:hypothetical protein